MQMPPIAVRRALFLIRQTGDEKGRNPPGRAFGLGGALDLYCDTFSGFLPNRVWYIRA